ncbi:MAG: cupin domain-containing protein [Chloroflexi bacterium]|nr:cupin domain-containing protein [Chloroflexota bacterium]
MPFYDPSQRPSRIIAPGVHIKTMWGERIMISLVDLAAGSQVPAHTHPHEQMGMVLKGRMTMVIEGESRDLRAGEVYLIPSGVEHSVSRVNVATRVVDIFSPPREDYK